MVCTMLYVGVLAFIASSAKLKRHLDSISNSTLQSYPHLQML